MLEEMTTNHYTVEWEKRINSCKGTIQYCKEALSFPELEEWERKEYEIVLKANEKLLPELEETLERVRSFIWA